MSPRKRPRNEPLALCARLDNKAFDWFAVLVLIGFNCNTAAGLARRLFFRLYPRRFSVLFLL